MLYAFMIALVFGACVFCSVALFGKRMPGVAARNFYHAGVAAWTVGSFMKGVLEIYGTTNRLIRVYWVAGAAFVAAGVICYARKGIGKAKNGGNF